MEKYVPSFFSIYGIDFWLAFFFYGICSLDVNVSF